MRKGFLSLGKDIFKFKFRSYSEIFLKTKFKNRSLRVLQKIPTIPNHGYALFKILGFRSTPNFDVPRLCCWCLRRFFQFTVRALNLGLRNLICTKKIFMSFSFVPFPSYNRVLLRHLRIKTVSCIMKTMSVEMNNWFQ